MNTKTPFFNVAYRYGDAADRVIFPTFISNEAMTDPAMAKIAGSRFQKEHLIVDFGNLSMKFWHLKDFLRARNEIAVKQLKKNNLPRFVEIVNRLCFEAIQITSRISRCDSGGALAVYSAVYQHYKKLCTYAYTANLLDRNLTDMLRSDLASVLSDGSDIEKALLILTRNPRANFVYNHDLELIALLNKHRRAARTEVIFSGHAKRWVGLFCGGGSSIANKEIVWQRIEEFSDLSRGQLLAKRADIYKQYREAERGAVQLAKKLSLSKEIIAKAELLKDAILLKETRKLAMVRIDDAVNPVFEKMAVAAGIQAKNLKYLLPLETSSLLSRKKRSLLTDAFIDELKGRSLIVIKDGRSRRFFGDGFAQKIKALGLEEELTKNAAPKDDGKSSRVGEKAPRVYEKKGFVACVGRIVGPARVVLSPADFHKVKTGDVLVASLTTPEYVSIFDRVAGMITFDGGGLTSHPATLAREYHIPAILGLKDLDGVLSDGDLVEIDADNNKVTILGR